MADVTKDPQPYMDEGTGAYDPPAASVTVESPADVESTGAVEGPPAEVTVESPPDHLEGPTGAHPGPPAEVTRYEWPAVDPSATKKQVKGDEVEDKAVKRPSTRGK